MAKTSSTSKSLHPLAAPSFADIARYLTLNGQRIHERNLSHLTPRRGKQLFHGWVDDGYLYAVELSVLKVLPDGQKIPQRIPRLYFCTPKAADVVENELGWRPTRVLQSQPSAQLFFHRYQTSESMLLTDRSGEAAKLPDIRWLLESDMRADAPKGAPPNQRSVLYHSFDEGDRTISVRLDAAFWMELPQGNDKPPVTLLGAFETDLSSEGVRQLTRTKPRGFHYWLERQEFRRYWNQSPDLVRIFWCVPSAKRIASIEKSLAEQEDILTISRFVTQADRDTKNLITDPVWYHPLEGKKVAILNR